VKLEDGQVVSKSWNELSETWSFRVDHPDMWIYPHVYTFFSYINAYKYACSPLDPTSLQFFVVFGGLLCQFTFTCKVLLTTDILHNLK